MWIVNTYLMLLAFQLLLANNHIISIILIISTCFLISVNLFFTSINHWYAIIIILVYISGIIVLFIFIISLSPNENNNTNNQNSWIIPPIPFILILSFNPLLTLESININSILITSLTLFSLITTMIILSAYIPPNILITLLNGINTSN